MVNSYMCCCSLPVGVAVYGLLQLNAAMFFFWNFTTFKGVSFYFDLAFAVVYFARFFVFAQGSFADDMHKTEASRQRLFASQKISALVLLGLMVLQTIVYQIEWAHFEVLTGMGYAIIIAFNVYHFFVLRAFADFADDLVEDYAASINEPPEELRVVEDSKRD